MKEKPAPARTLSRLAHPVLLLALGLILLNALILQPSSPSWFSGKLADLAWMIVLPVAAASLLGLFWPASEKRNFWVSTAVIAAGFALVKTLPSANIFVRDLFLNLFRARLKLTLDPSDLLALAGIFIAAWVWGRGWRVTRRIWRFAPVVLLAVAGMADAVDPGYDQIDCLALDGQAIIAFTPERSLAYFGNASERKAYLSLDNGRTWEDLGTFSPDEEGEAGSAQGIDVTGLIGECRVWNQQVLVEDPLNPRVQYMIVSDQGVYRSFDGAETLIREFSVPEEVDFKDVVFAPDNQTLVIAASTHGVLLRQADGRYVWADPSGMSLTLGN